MGESRKKSKITMFNAKGIMLKNAFCNKEKKICRHEKINEKWIFIKRYDTCIQKYMCICKYIVVLKCTCLTCVILLQLKLFSLRNRISTFWSLSAFASVATEKSLCGFGFTLSTHLEIKNHISCIFCPGTYKSLSLKFIEYMEPSLILHLNFF